LKAWLSSNIPAAEKPPLHRVGEGVLEGGVAGEIDVRGLPGKLFGVVSGRNQKGRQTGAGQRGVTQGADGPLFDFVRQQSDPLDDIAANEVAEFAGVENILQVAWPQPGALTQDDNASANRACGKMQFAEIALRGRDQASRFAET